jgi:hypothetical protein
MEHCQERGLGAHMQVPVERRRRRWWRRQEWQGRCARASYVCARGSGCETGSEEMKCSEALGVHGRRGRRRGSTEAGFTCTWRGCCALEFIGVASTGTQQVTGKQRMCCLSDGDSSQWPSGRARSPRRVEERHERVPRSVSSRPSDAASTADTVAEVTSRRLELSLRG